MISTGHITSLKHLMIGS
jgi:hypothetical protein